VKKQKMPRDPMQRAKMVIDLATGEAEPDPEQPKDQAAVESGRRGGLIGGKARAAKLTPQQRSEIARTAATKRWSQSDKG
jgi:hypothetical protein